MEKWNGMVVWKCKKCEAVFSTDGELNLQVPYVGYLDKCPECGSKDFTTVHVVP